MKKEQKNFKFFLTILVFLGRISILYAAPTRIMPLGDSITFDARYDDTRSDSVRTGYRSHLYYKLVDAKYEVNFVGSRIAGEAITPPFDPDNEGHPSWTSFEIAEDAYTFMTQSNPDIVLLHIGTNDLTSTTPWGVDATLNEIDYYEQKTGRVVQVIVALIIDRQIHDGRIASFNTRLKETLEKRIIDGDNIIMVDMYSGAGLTSEDYADNTHPNDTGYSKMADVWFNALMQPYTPALYAFPSTIVNSSYIQSQTVDELAQSVTFITEVPDTGINF